MPPLPAVGGRGGVKATHAGAGVWGKVDGERGGAQGWGGAGGRRQTSEHGAAPAGARARRRARRGRVWLVDTGRASHGWKK